jgi:hypothetical protein
MNFFVLDQPNACDAQEGFGPTDASREDGFTTGEALRCPQCSRYLTMLRWLPPYRVELHTWGSEYGDFADIGQEMIVSERFAQVFQENGLQGLSGFEPIEIVKVTHHSGTPSQPLPRYVKANVTLSPTTVDQRASGYVWADESKVCPACLFDDLKRFDRIVIKEDTWNGDDIFFPRGGTRILVSDRFKSLCEQHGFLGVVFRPADQESYDHYPWEREQGASA